MDSIKSPADKTKATDYIGKIISVKIDRPIGSKHHTYNMFYSLNYGFVPGTIAPDGEELDVYILGIHTPIETFTGKCVAVIHRLNDNDDKLIAVTENYNPTDNDIRVATNFQEQFFKIEIIRSA